MSQAKFKGFIAIAALMLGLLSACKTARQTEQVSIQSKEISTEWKERDTIILSPRAVTSFKVPIDTDTVMDTVFSTHNQATARASVKGKMLSVECECDTVQIAATLRDKYRKELREDIKETTEIVPQRYVPRWISVLAWIGAFALVVGIAVVSFKLR